MITDGTDQSVLNESASITLSAVDSFRAFISSTVSLSSKEFLKVNAASIDGYNIKVGYVLGAVLIAAGAILYYKKK